MKISATLSSIGSEGAMQYDEDVLVGCGWEDVIHHVVAVELVLTKMKNVGTAEAQLEAGMGIMPKLEVPPGQKQ